MNGARSFQRLAAWTAVLSAPLAFAIDLLRKPVQIQVLDHRRQTNE